MSPQPKSRGFLRKNARPIRHGVWRYNGLIVTHGSQHIWRVESRLGTYTIVHVGKRGLWNGAWVARRMVTEHGVTGGGFRVTPDEDIVCAADSFGGVLRILAKRAAPETQEKKADMLNHPRTVGRYGARTGG